jgi:hypothetical protein
VAEVAINSKFIEYLCKNCLGFFSEFTFHHHRFISAPALWQLHSIKLLSVEFKLVKSKPMIFYDVKIWKLKPNVQWTNLEDICNLKYHFKKRFIRGELLLDYFLGVITHTTVVVDL